MGEAQLKSRDPRTIFNPVLFWDAKQIDVEKHALYIISRVLDYGDESDIRDLRALYPDEKLIEAIKRRRGLMPQTGKFWAVYFNIPLEEIACLRRFYQRRRLR